MRTINYSLSAALEAFEEASKQGRSCSFHWENGRFVEPFKISDVPKNTRPECGATCRDGHPCKAKVCLKPDGSAAKRCRLHGGLSSGPKTKEGRQRIAQSNRKRGKAPKVKDGCKNNEERALLIARGLQVVAEIERRQREGLPILD